MTDFPLSVPILQPYYVALEALNCLFLFSLSFVFYIHSFKEVRQCASFAQFCIQGGVGQEEPGLVFCSKWTWDPD